MTGTNPEPPESIESALESILWHLLLMTPSQPLPWQWLEGIERRSAYFRALVAPGITPDQQELSRATVDMITADTTQTNQKLQETALLANHLLQTVNEQQAEIQELRESLRSLRENRR